MNELLGETAELKGKLEVQKTLEAQWNLERSSLNRHIESLNDAAVKYQRRVDSLEADNRRLMQVSDNASVDGLILLG